MDNRSEAIEKLQGEISQMENTADVRWYNTLMGSLHDFRARSEYALSRARKSELGLSYLSTIFVRSKPLKACKEPLPDIDDWVDTYVTSGGIIVIGKGEKVWLRRLDSP